MNFKVRAATKEDCKEISRMIMLLPGRKVNVRKWQENDLFSLSGHYLFNTLLHRQHPYGLCVKSRPELAVFVKKLNQVKISHEELELDGFCQNPFFDCLVAEVPKEHKSTEGFTIVGYAVYFYTYTTRTGRSVYLEDLYVMPEFRGNGIGTGLLTKLAEVSKKKQCVQLQLSVYNWNTPARDFYAAKGAQDLTVSEGRHFMRFDGQNLDNLANEAPKD